MFVKACQDKLELEHIHMLLIGLGGGALPQFINNNLHNVSTGTIVWNAYFESGHQLVFFLCST